MTRRTGRWRGLDETPAPAAPSRPAALGAYLGVILPPSHNPMPDNGIKLFARGGHKLADDIEAEIEAEVAAGPPSQRPIGAAIGRVRDASDAAARYMHHLLAAVPVSLDGLHVVVDCANGSASTVAPEV